MRITNKIIQNNSLTNINGNKILQDKLSTQIATEKKISRPSDDPIIALRSLRLRTSVNQTDQFRTKNAEDAESWLEVTEDAITTLSDIITDIRKQYVKGASDTLTTADRQIILENLQALAEEVYNTGNADFAGRSIFTGYRTDSDLTFQKADDIMYSITENESSLSLDNINHTFYKENENNEINVSNVNISRIRLSYNNIYADTQNGTTINVKVTAADGTVYENAAEVVFTTDTSDPYQWINDEANAGKMCVNAETGEILIGADLATQIGENPTGIEVTYQRNQWSKGELRPEHYFDCVDETNDITYSTHGGEIEYNIGVNQSLRINTNAEECFNHDIMRDLDDIVKAINDVDDMEAKVNELKNKLNAMAENDPDRENVQNQLDAAQKAYTFVNEKLANLFSNGITKAEGYLTRNNLALTNCGTRSKRLELIENRLDTQLSTLKELKSDNEDVDMAEVAVKLSSAEYAYDASLMATSKILQQTLLNYL